ncbi:MAG: biotin/lipoyl-containing protein, partial [Burkholderiaceae bacterium]
MAQVELRVPDIGDFKEVEVIEVLVKAGDEIGVEQSLITVESDKASMEIPASHAGRLLSLAVKVGDKVSEGSLVGLVESSSTVSPVSPAEGVTGSAGENVAKPFETTKPSPEALGGTSARPVDAPSSSSSPSP